jgi:CRISPR/Cas system CSM-associated protein Csm3 (group 7 of RAMP superfamily)
MTIKYKIELLSDWCIGSGTDSSTDADELVLKNDKGLPFVGGKAIKGLLKDAVNDMIDVGRCEKEIIKKVFTQTSHNDEPYFSNANLLDDVSKEIINNGLTEFLYRNIKSTAINNVGVAKKKSLRTIQVTMPVSLFGEIDNVNKDDIETLLIAFKLIRHLGRNRNRGLGRCKFSAEKSNGL